MKPWEDVDRYIENTLVPSDTTLDQALAADSAAGLPPHDVSRASENCCLYWFASSSRIWRLKSVRSAATVRSGLRALPVKGRLISLEIDPFRAELARKNIRRGGLEARVEVREGPAIERLRKLKDEGTGPFDFIFIDADKPNNPEYLEWALELSRPGTVIIGDNVIRNGAVADAQGMDQNVVGVRRFLEEIGRHPRLSATAIQTVGLKGYDGFMIARVLPS